MAYRVVLAKAAVKQLDKLEPKTRKLIAAFIERELSGCEDPRSVPNGKALVGVEGGWRWRVGAYRILGRISDGELIIELIKIGHRRDVYRNLR